MPAKRKSDSMESTVSQVGSLALNITTLNTANAGGSTTKKARTSTATEPLDVSLPTSPKSWRDITLEGEDEA